MSSLTTIYRSSWAFITDLTRARASPLALRIMVWALVANTVIFPAVLIKLSSSLYIAPVLDSTEIKLPVGSNTTLFMQKLENNNFVPVVFKKIVRHPLTGDGSLVTLKVGDSIDSMQIFEYIDYDTAMRDASLLADKYATGSKKLVWNKNMHVYVDDKLVIFYLGNHAPILTALDQSAVAFARPPESDIISSILIP